MVFLHQTPPFFFPPVFAKDEERGPPTPSGSLFLYRSCLRNPESIKAEAFKCSDFFPLCTGHFFMSITPGLVLSGPCLLGDRAQARSTYFFCDPHNRPRYHRSGFLSLGASTVTPEPLSSHFQKIEVSGPSRHFLFYRLLLFHVIARLVGQRLFSFLNCGRCDPIDLKMQ